MTVCFANVQRLNKISLQKEGKSMLVPCFSVPKSCFNVPFWKIIGRKIQYQNFKIIITYCISVV